MTVVEWLINHIDIKFIGNTDKYIEKAKEMELEQRKEDFRKGWQGNKHKDWNCEFYLIKHINNNFKSE